MSDTTYVCAGIDWDYNTDDSLGGSSQEWEEATDPDDITTSLSSDECVMDTTNGTIIIDLMSGCIKGADVGIAIGSHPLLYIKKKIRIRHLTPGEKRRLRKKLLG